MQTIDHENVILIDLQEHIRGCFRRIDGDPWCIGDIVHVQRNRDIRRLVLSTANTLSRKDRQVIRTVVITYGMIRQRSQHVIQIGNSTFQA